MVEEKEFLPPAFERAWQKEGWEKQIRNHILSNTVGVSYGFDIDEVHKLGHTEYFHSSSFNQSAHTDLLR